METEPKLSIKVRIIIGLLAIPSLMLGAVVISLMINQNTKDLSFFEIIYALVGIFAMYIALTGKKFF